MQTVGLCLAGFVSAIRITSLLDMGMLRNTCAFDHSELQTSRPDMIHGVILLASSLMLRTKFLCPALLPQSVSDNRVSAVF